MATVHEVKTRVNALPLDDEQQGQVDLLFKNLAANPAKQDLDIYTRQNVTAPDNMVTGATGGRRRVHLLYAQKTGTEWNKGSSGPPTGGTDADAFLVMYDDADDTIANATMRMALAFVERHNRLLITSKEGISTFWNGITVQSTTLPTSGTGAVGMTNSNSGDGVDVFLVVSEA